jgi:hypothetical protein
MGIKVKCQKKAGTKEMLLFLNGQQFVPGIVKQKTNESNIEQETQQQDQNKEGKFDSNIPLDFSSDSEKNSLDFENFEEKTEALKETQQKTLYTKFD